MTRTISKEQTMKTVCVHSCRGLCNALEIAEHHEQQAIKEYRQYLEGCDYPEVRDILTDLIKEREKGLITLQEKKKVLAVKFDTLNSVNDSFA